MVDVAPVQRAYIPEVTSRKIQGPFGCHRRNRNPHLLADQVVDQIFDRDATGLRLRLKPLL
jgi:hypothetical protein